MMFNKIPDRTACVESYHLCFREGGFHKGCIIPKSALLADLQRVGFNSWMSLASECLAWNLLLETWSNSEEKVLPENVFLPFISQSSVPWRIFPFVILYYICIWSFSCSPDILNIFTIPPCISGILIKKCFSAQLERSSLLFALLLYWGIYNSSSSKCGNIQSKHNNEKSWEWSKRPDRTYYTNWLESKDWFLCVSVIPVGF